MAGARGSQSGGGFERELRDMNEALLVSSIHQQELAEQAQRAEAALRRSEAELRAYSEELARFNRVAVGRELRLVELKRELNELARRHGEPPRYVLESEDEAIADSGERSMAELEHSRRAAALNLMEDAVQSRRAMEKTNAELRASEAQYRTLFTSIDEGFCVIEMLFDHGGGPVDYRFLETNPGFEKQTGLRGAAGKRIRELAPNHEAHWFEKFAQVALTGESVRFVNFARDLGGRWFDVYAFRLGEPDSCRVAILFTDITERIRLEEAASRQARSLEDLNRRKDEFLAMLSHELRNPLAAILNAARLLRLQQDRNSVQIEAQEMIDRQSVQLTRLLEDLLEVSRISTGRIRVHMEPVDLPVIVYHAIETVRPQVDKKGLSIAMALPDRPLWVDGDPVRLEQIVVNLLTNATKYTDRSGHIRLELKVESDEAVLRVRDDGMGIAPEMLPHIFDLFAQADRSLERAQGGLGIGLALVQSLVTIHRGRVEVQSKLDEGSEFVVRLPTRPSPKAPPAADTVEGMPAPARARALKVLVVDDNLDAARSAALLLQALGHDARSAHDGASATKAALEYVPDVVLLDIGLPVIDGWQVAARIRQEPALGHVMLVAVTGYGQESDRRRAREAGFDHYLVKPMDWVKVKATLSAAAANPR